MKRLLGPALLLFVVGGVVAWYALAVSLRAEREYTAWVHALADDESTRVLESRFERGWLHSRAETSIEMSGGAGLAFRAFVTALGAVDVRERVGLHMVHGIEHGPLPLWEWLRAGMDGAPVLARIRSTVEIDQESQLELAEAIGKLPPVEAETIVRAAGQATTHLSVAAQRLRAHGEGFARDARFQGASGDLEFRDRYRYVSGTLQSPGFAGRGRERAVELRDVTWLFELPGSELPVGRMELGAGELRVAPAEGDGGLTLEDVLLEPSGRVAAGRLEADLRLRVRSGALGAQAFGPATLALDLRDLDAAALRRLRRAGLRLQEGHTGSDPVATAVAAGELAEALPALLDRGPRAELRELRLATPAGPIAARGRVALARPDLSKGSLSAGSFFDAELEAEAPAAAAEAILASLVSPVRVSELRAKGALASDGERARLRAEWRGGALRLNGVPVPLPAPAPEPAPAAAPAAETAPAAEAASAAREAPAAEGAPAADSPLATAPSEGAAPAAAVTEAAAPEPSEPAAPTPAAAETSPAAPAP
jgi:hypothetical protein